MPFSVRTIAVAADTPVQVAGRDVSETAKVNTKARSLNIKLNFIPTSTAAVVQIAETSAKASTGYPLQSTDPAVDTVFQGDDEIELVANDALWVHATEAGTLYVLVV
jgi:hypothetical protein